jgi:outer membrane protein assembly factor BamB
VLVAAAPLQAAPAADPAKEVNARLLSQVEPRLKALYETDQFRMRGFSAAWLPDSSGYLKLETPDGAPEPEIARYDSASGERTVVAGEKLAVPGTSGRLKIHGFVCSPTGKRFLLHTDEADGTNRWIYETESGSLRPVKAGDGVGFDANAFSPDERSLLGSRDSELIVFDIASGRTTQGTQDSDPDAISHSRTT